jgi:hypothetical protein
MGIAEAKTLGVFGRGTTAAQVSVNASEEGSEESFVFVCHRSSGVDYVAPRWNDGLDLWLGLTLLMSA